MMRLGLILCAFGLHAWRDYGDGSGDGCSRCQASRSWHERPRWRRATEGELEAELERINRRYFGHRYDQVMAEARAQARGPTASERVRGGLWLTS